MMNKVCSGVLISAQIFINILTDINLPFGLIDVNLSHINR